MNQYCQHVYLPIGQGTVPPLFLEALPCYDKENKKEVQYRCHAIDVKKTRYKITLFRANR